MSFDPALNERFGTFLQSDSTRQAMGVTQETLDSLTQSHCLLRVQTEDGIELYPELQFDESGSIEAKLTQILQTLLPTATDSWTVLYWLTAPLALYGGRTPSELLREGTAAEAQSMFTMAQRDAAAWKWLR